MEGHILQNGKNSTILQATLDWNSKVPACRHCKIRPNSDTILKHNGLPDRCANRECRSTTAYLNDKEYAELKSNHLTVRMESRWVNRKPKVAKEVVKRFGCNKCDRIYDDDQGLERHEKRRH